MGEQVAAQEVTELSSQDLDDFEKADILTKVWCTHGGISCCNVRHKATL